MFVVFKRLSMKNRNRCIGFLLFSVCTLLVFIMLALPGISGIAPTPTPSPAPGPGSDFTLQAQPDELNATAGETVETDVIAQFQGVCEGPIVLSISGLPRQIRASFRTNTLTSDRRQTVLELEVGNETPEGRYPLVVTGVGCDLERTADILLIIGPSQMTIVKRQSKSSIEPGSEQTYTLTITNNSEIKEKGQVTATGITVTDTLDANLAYISDTSGAVHKVEGRTHTWFFKRELDPGQFISFEINTRMSEEIKAGVSIANSALLKTDQLLDPAESNRVVAVSDFIPVGPQGLRITKRVSRRSARIGKILVYRVDIENISNGAVFDLELEDLLPSGFKLVKDKVLRDGRRFDNPSGNRRLRWNLGTLKGQSTTRLRYQVIIGANARRGRNFNTALAKGVDGGGNKVQAQAKAVVQLGAAAVLELGQIKATVYIDRNNDRRLDAGDEKLPAIGVLMATGEKHSTDDDGEAVFEDITPGFHVVAVDERTLPEDLQLVGESSRLISVLEAENAEVAFPLAHTPQATPTPAPTPTPPPLKGSAEGHVFYDINANGRFEPDTDRPIGGVTVKIRSDIKTTVTDENGYYRFDNMEPGAHVVWIDPATLPKPYRPLDNQPIKKIVVQPGGVAETAIADFIVLKAQIYEEGVVEGMVCLDLNNNLSCDPDEPGIVGVTVYDPPALSVTVDQISPGTNNTPVQLCDEIQFRVTIVNNGNEAAQNVVIQNGMPASGFAGVSPLAANPQVLAAIENIPANGRVTPVFTFTLTCDAVSGDNTTVVSQDGFDAITVTRPFTITPGAITIAKEAIEVNGVALAAPTSEPPAEIGDMITWRIRITSSGLGNVADVVVKDALGAGLTLVGGDAPEPNPDYPAEPYQYIFNSATHGALSDMAPNTSVDIFIETRVDACEALTNEVEATWGCSPTERCFAPVAAQASVDLTTFQPLLAYTHAPVVFPVSYCGDSPVVVRGIRVPIFNTGAGTAFDVALEVDFGADFTVSNILPATVSYSGGRFIDIGDIDSGATVDLQYDLTFTPPADWCAAGDPGRSGTWNWIPHYEDECQVPFAPPLNQTSYTIDAAGGPPPELTVTKSCTRTYDDGGTPVTVPVGLITPILDVEQTVTCTIEVEYNEPVSCGAGNSAISVTDTYPNQWTALAMTPPNPLVIISMLPPTRSPGPSRSQISLACSLIPRNLPLRPRGPAMCATAAVRSGPMR
jgi:uncharacterized repeat protein (TIGR01451 family)